MDSPLTPDERYQIELQRQSNMRDVLRQRQVDRWPNPCPTCFTDVGERCVTVNGKRAEQHKDRLPSVLTTTPRHRWAPA